MKKRRTQSERSAATRTALLGAAKASLSELGYAGTTTTETARRAGVSRGAQLHQFATKQDLLLAAIDFIHGKVEEDVEQISHRIDAGTDEDIRLFICELWNKVFSPDNFNPNLELVAAARTNAELAERLKKRWKKLAGTYETIWAKTLARSGHVSPEGQALLLLTVNFLRGMALQRVAVGDDPDYFRAQLQQWTAIVRLVLRQAAPVGQEAST